MTLEEIKQAVLSGKTVHWSNTNYVVIKDNFDQWLIECNNGSCIGLTWSDGKTLNGKKEDFYVATTAEERLALYETLMIAVSDKMIDIAKRLDDDECSYDQHDAYVDIKEAAWALMNAVNARS